MRFFTKTKIFLLVLFIVVGASMVLPVRHVHAQNLNISANIDWIDGQASCYGTVNGQTQYFYDAIAGDNITINMTNVSSQFSLDVQVTEAGHSTFSTTLAPSGSASTTFPVNSEITLEANGSSCQSGRGGPGDLLVEAATGSLSCTIQNNQIWTVSFNYSGIGKTVTLYRDNTYVYQVPFNRTVINESLQFAAQASVATYNLFYGSDSSGRLLGQSSCPAKTATTPASPPTTPKNTSTTKSTAPPSPATNTPTPNTSTTSTNTTNPTTNTQNPGSQNKSPHNPKSPKHSSSTALHVVLGVGIVAILSVVFVGILQAKGVISLGKVFPF